MLFHIQKQQYILSRCTENELHRKKVYTGIYTRRIQNITTTAGRATREVKGSSKKLVQSEERSAANGK